MKLTRLLVMSTGALGVVATFLWLLDMSPWNADVPAIAYAVSPRFVARGGTDSGDCTDNTNPCASVQYAVDVANQNDEIHVASGVYTGVQARPRMDVTTTGMVTQMVYISKSVTIRGGYTVTNWTMADAIANPTTLDAQFKGRVLYITGNISPTITGLQVTRGNANRLGGVPGPSDGGAGVYIINASTTLSNNNISGNDQGYGTLAGGGLYLRFSNSKLISNTIIHNTSSSDGAGIVLDNSPATLNSNTIMSNFNTFAGGGLELIDSAAELNGNTIAGNGAPYGGGLNLTLSPAILSGNLIINNTAYFGYGGGLYLNASDAMLVNNVIAGNYVDDYGSAVYVNQSNAKLLHNTIARNTLLKGSAVYVNVASTVVMTNTILSDHYDGVVVYASYSSHVIINGVLWFHNPIDTVGQGYVTITNAYTGSPAFAADGYHLTAVSAAIDRGIMAGITTDIDGDSRPSGIAPDLGADEYEGPPATRTYLPMVFR